MAMTDAEKSFFREHTFTLKGRIFHPALLSPKTNKEGTRTNFNTMFAFRAEDNMEMMAKLNAFLGNVKQTMYPTVPMNFFVNPIKKYETYQRRDGRPNPDYLKGHYWVNAATGKDMPPTVCKQSPMGLVTLTANDEAEVYSGRNAVIHISFYKIAKDQQGLSTNVNAVLLLDGGEHEGGNAGVNVNQVFQGFASDMGFANAFGNTAAPMGNGGYANSATGPQNAPSQGMNGQTAPTNASPSDWTATAPQAQPAAAPTQNINPFAPNPAAQNNGGGFI